MNAGGERLRAGDVIEHIQQILLDESMFKWFGLDHSKMLLRDILCRRVYWQDISKENWHGSLRLFSRANL